jgi:magnesium transporter
MLTLDGEPAQRPPAAMQAGTAWIDLLDATPEEIAWAERQTGLHVPSPAELDEIETSSRLRSHGGALYLTSPVVYRDASGLPVATGVGFVLDRHHLITVRHARLTAFTTFGAEWAAREAPHPGTSGAAFVGLLDALVDRMADVLEIVGTELDAVSHRVFRAGQAGPPAREDADLRETLRRIGRSGDLASKIRDSLLGVGRIVPYVHGQCSGWMPAELHARLDIQRADIASLNDYDAYLTNKVQLLLDATLGLINIEQNNIIKVLTIVSVVGVPPTLVASMYGMNFHNMPELNWAWGYPWGLSLILLSAIGPLVWFKIRGWL